MTLSATPARRGGREARRAIRTQRNIEMLPQLTRGLPYLEPLNQEQLLQIHNASMAILEEVGVDFRDEVALQQWRAAGARIDGQRVYLDREQVMELIASIPEEITLHARDPRKSVTIGKGRSIFVPMTGAAHAKAGRSKNLSLAVCAILAIQEDRLSVSY